MLSISYPLFRGFFYMYPFFFAQWRIWNLNSTVSIDFFLAFSLILISSFILP